MKKQTISMPNGIKVIITNKSDDRNIAMFNDYIKRVSK